MAAVMPKRMTATKRGARMDAREAFDKMALDAIEDRTEEDWETGFTASKTFDKVDDKTAEEWRLDVMAASVAVQRLRSDGGAHEDAAVLTRTMERHRALGRPGFCSTKPGQRTWTTNTGLVRAVFYARTADQITAEALRGFRGRRLGGRATDLMLRRATSIMNEVAEVVAADSLSDIDAFVARTNHNLRDVKKVVELVRRRDVVAVQSATSDRRQRLRARCRGASAHAKLARNGRGRPESLPGRKSTGTCADDAGSRAVRHSDNPTTWERGCAVAPRGRRRKRRRRHRRRCGAKTKADPLRSAAADFDSERTKGTADDEGHGPRKAAARAETTADDEGHGPPHDDATAEDGSHVAVSLERFVSEMEAEQDEAIDAVLDLTVGNDENAVALEEEACWVSERGADDNAGGHFDGGTQDPDHHPDTMVEPAHRAASPRRGAVCSKCEQEFYSASGQPICRGCRDKCLRCQKALNYFSEKPICYNCRDRCTKCEERFYSKSGHHMCGDCRDEWDKCSKCGHRHFSASGKKVCVECRR